MAQGGGKIKSKPMAKKAKPAHHQKKQLSKGRKAFTAKRSAAVSIAKSESQTSKAINKKNEMAVAARAVNAGNTFFSKDVKEAGKKELGKNKDKLRKKEGKMGKMKERLEEQLKKLK
jgi:chaperonin cofactor prefoldin